DPSGAESERQSHAYPPLVIRMSREVELPGSTSPSARIEPRPFWVYVRSSAGASTEPAPENGSYVYCSRKRCPNERRDTSLYRRVNSSEDSRVGCSAELFRTTRESA